MSLKGFKEIAMNLRNVVSALAFVVLAGGACSAQFTLRGSISGTVTDTSHAVVPGANVTITDVDRNQSHKAETNASGLYTFTELTIGHYQVSVEHAGFRPVKTPVIALATGQVARFDLTLEVGAITEAIEVAASTPLMEAGQAVVGATIEQDMLTALPVKGRNFTDYALLAPNIYSFANSGSGGALTTLLVAVVTTACILMGYTPIPVG